MPTVVLLAVFLLATVAVGWVYALYPVLLWGMVAITGGARDVTDDRPSVTLIVAAYNEEDVIAEKIENSLALEYSGDLEIVVFSDASSDRTDDIVRSYADRGVRLRRIEGRVGKTECQNRVAARADGDIIAFTDANAMLEPDAVERLVERFTDGVGCVVGELRLINADGDVTGESLYWRFARTLKRLESRLTSVVRGNGAIYAVRNEAYVPLAPDEISDLAEPLAVRAAGWGVSYEPRAVAREHTAGSVEAERSRKVRINTRAWHTLPDYVGLANPLRHGIYAVQFATETFVWWLTPLFVAAGFVAALGLALAGPAGFAPVAGPLGIDPASLALAFDVLGVLALGFGALVVGGAALERRDRSTWTPLHVPHYFALGNYTMLVGFWNFLTGRNIVTWETADGHRGADD